MAIGERIRLAREQIGLSGAEVERRTGIGASSLSEWEHGKREPRLSQLQTLARLYRRSVAFFLEDHPTPRPVILWRMKPPDEKRGELEARFLQLCEQYHNLEVWCDEKAPVALPQATGTASTYGYRDAEELARGVRNDLRLGDRPAAGLLRVIEEACGVKVFHLPGIPPGTAASAVGETFGPAVLLNAASAPWRRTSDLAHELFHILTWAMFRRGEPNPPSVPGEREEQFALCFARDLLLPEEALRSALHLRMKDGGISYTALVGIAREFEVSVELLIWRIHFLDRTRSEEDRTRTQADIEKAKCEESLLERREWPEPPVWPDRYRALGVKALRRGDISLGRFAEYLGISRQEAMHYVEQEIADDGAIQVDPA